jgi:hypothetical protein
VAESGLKPERTIDLAHPDEIEIRRLRASSRGEAEGILAPRYPRAIKAILDQRSSKRQPSGAVPI